MVREIEKYVYLTTLDEKWMDHLDGMESLRDGIGLRGYAQRDPLVEYQQEAYKAFERLVGEIETSVVNKIYRLNPASQPPPPQNVILRKAEAAGVGPERSRRKDVIQPESAPESSKKVGRNDPCPCGSGLKYKKCGLIGAPQHKA